MAAREQGTLFTVRENHNSVSVDVNDAAAKRVKAYRPAERLVFAQSVAALLGIPVEENALINIGKRGVSNAGFRVVLWKEKGEQA